MQLFADIESFVNLAIEKGYLVPMSEIDQTDIYTEIDKNHGWRLIKQARDWTRYEPSSLTIEKFNLYTTYKTNPKFPCINFPLHHYLHFLL